MGVSTIEKFPKAEGVFDCFIANQSLHYCHLPGANCANAARRS